MPTLAADPGSFALAGQATAGALYAGSGLFGFGGQEVAFTRSFDVASNPLALKLDRLRLHEAIVEASGKPTWQFQLMWQRHCEAIEQAFAGLVAQVEAIQAAYDAAAQASAAASNANNAVDAVQGLATEVQETVEQIQEGVYNFSTIMVGGDKFANVNGALEPI